MLSNLSHDSLGNAGNGDEHRHGQVSSSDHTPAQGKSTSSLQGHAHEHRHPHDHQHTHTTKPSEPPSESVLLNYMLDHNRHHADELEQLAFSLEAKGQHEAAKATRRALRYYQEGNDQLSKAASHASAAEQALNVDPSKSTELAKVVEIAKATELARIVEQPQGSATQTQEQKTVPEQHETTETPQADEDDSPAARQR